MEPQAKMLPLQDIIPGHLPQLESPNFEESLGDIFLCASIIKQQCIEEESDFQSSLPVL